MAAAELSMQGLDLTDVGRRGAAHCQQACGVAADAFALTRG